MPCQSDESRCNLTTAEMLPELNKGPLLWPVNVRPSYSNLGFGLLGRAMEPVYGKRYAPASVCVCVCANGNVWYAKSQHRGAKPHECVCVCRRGPRPRPLGATHEAWAPGKAHTIKRKKPDPTNCVSPTCLAHLPDRLQ